MEFMLAKKEDMEIITSLYKAAIGSLGCTWNEHYPTREHTQADLERGDLYCIKTESGEIIGVIAIDDDKEVEALECWSKNGAELSRLVVRENYQNQGIAGQLLKETMAVLKKRGYSYVHFLVSKYHTKALRAYEKLNFDHVGESDLYDGNWWCYEKKL